MITQTFNNLDKFYTLLKDPKKGKESKLLTLDPQTIKEATSYLGSLNLKGGNGKIFLMALLIANHPNEIFEEPRNETEKSLIKKSKDFYNILNNQEEKQKEWDLYLEVMDQWRKGSKSEVEEEVKESYKNLTKIENNLPNDNETVLKEWIPYIEKEKGKLSSLMRRMSGSEKMEEMIQQSKIGKEVEEQVKKLNLPSEMLNNSKIVHELILNPKLEFQDIRKMLRYKESLNYVEGEEEEEEEGVLVDLELINSSPLARVEYILFLKEKLFSIVRNSDLLKRVEQWLAEDILKEEMKNTKNWKMENSLEVLLDAMAESCAPIRDVEVESIRSCNDLKSFLEGFHKLLIGMTTDMANFQLLLLKRQLAKGIVEYEKNFFSREYEKKEYLLNRSIDIYKSIYKSDHIEAIVDLIIDGPINDYLPLSLDTERVSKFRDRLTLSIKGSCIMLFMKGFSCNKNFENRISILLFNDDKMNNLSISNIIEECLNSRTGSGLENDKEKIQTGLKNIWKENDPMIKLLTKRVHLLVHKIIKDNILHKKEYCKTHISKEGIHHSFSQSIYENLDEISKMISLHLKVQEDVFYSKF